MAVSDLYILIGSLLIALHALNLLGNFSPIVSVQFPPFR